MIPLVYHQMVIPYSCKIYIVKIGIYIGVSGERVNCFQQSFAQKEREEVATSPQAVRNMQTA
jgi:hypothetical protein